MTRAPDGASPRGDVGGTRRPRAGGNRREWRVSVKAETSPHLPQGQTRQRPWERTGKEMPEQKLLVCKKTGSRCFPSLGLLSLEPSPETGRELHPAAHPHPTLFLRFIHVFLLHFPAVTGFWRLLFLCHLPYGEGTTPVPEAGLCPHPMRLLFCIQRAPNNAAAPTGTRQNQHRRSPPPSLPHLPPPASPNRLHPPATPVLHPTTKQHK